MAEGAPNPARRPRLAVVVGSGGIKCAAAVGMWKVLQREGIPFDMVVGCSGGSIYTAAMAMGMDALEAERLTLHMWNGLFKRLNYRTLLRSLLPGRLGFNESLGLVDDRAVGKVMRDLYADATFEQNKVPLHIAATDLRTGKPVEIRSGRIGDAVRASIAIPMLLRPWPMDGRLLVDGGMSDPLPVSIAIREGADIILAMGFETPPVERLGSMVGVAVQCISATVNHLLRSTYAFYSAAHHAEIVPMMPSFDHPVRIGDTHLIPHLIQRGEEAMEAELPYIRRLLAP